MWVETVTEGGRRIMAARRKEEVDTARHRQEKREATRLGNLFKKNLNASKSSEHPPLGEKLSKKIGGNIGCRDRNSSCNYVLLWLCWGTIGGCAW